MRRKSFYVSLVAAFCALTVSGCSRSWNELVPAPSEIHSSSNVSAASNGAYVLGHFQPLPVPSGYYATGGFNDEDDTGIVKGYNASFKAAILNYDGTLTDLGGECIAGQLSDRGYNLRA